MVVWRVELDTLHTHKAHRMIVTDKEFLNATYITSLLLRGPCLRAMRPCKANSVA